MHMVRLEEGGREAGVFRFDPRRFARPVRARPSVISIGARFEHDRRRTAAFIESVYQARYGARIRAHYPNLVAVRAADGTLAAAAGFRTARQGRLFLEQYTGDDVDRIVGVARERIVEIGNLASAGGDASVFLFAALAAYLDSVGISCAVITGTASLERRLNLLGLQPRRICAADPARLTGEPGDWGTYYDRSPHVLSGDIGQAAARLGELFGTDFFLPRPRLFPQLHFDPATT